MQATPQSSLYGSLPDHDNSGRGRLTDIAETEIPGGQTLRYIACRHFPGDSLFGAMTARTFP